jgi:predicted RNase H-like HicB family nuclease
MEGYANELADTGPGGSHRNFRHKASEASMNVKRYPVIIEPTSTGFSAYSPDVSGCASAGDTVEETCLNFQDVLASHFEARREVGETIPDPRCSVAYVEIAG